jgi:hypothetical protein
MAGKNTTISNIQPAAGNLRIQTSVYGAAIPLVYGRTRISGNLLWYGGFAAIPHTSTTSSGGKGGGSVKQSTTDYTYTAAIVMALGEGVMNTVISAWKGKTRVAGVASASVPATITETGFTVPSSGPVAVGHWATFLANVAVNSADPEAFEPLPDGVGSA